MFQSNRAALSASAAVWPLLAFLAITISFLLAQTIYDPWSWERLIVNEIPAESYGKCQSKNSWFFFGPLMGIIFFAEVSTLIFAWKTVDVPSDFRDAGAITYTCLVQVQAWAVGIPMLGVLGYSSADATYFARIFLTWIFSVSSVTVIVCPKILRVIRSRLGTQYEGTGRRKGRVNVAGVYEPSASSYWDERSANASGLSQSPASPRKVKQKNALKLTKSEMQKIHQAAEEISSSHQSN